MFYNILQNKEKLSKYHKSSQFLLKQMETYLSSLTDELNESLDFRFVKTFFDLFAAIIINRNQKMTLLLSELGGFIAGFDKAPAGTKRISNLLRCGDWTHHFIDTWLFERALERVQETVSQGLRPLYIWDDSVIEKHESRVIGAYVACLVVRVSD